MNTPNLTQGVSSSWDKVSDEVRKDVKGVIGSIYSMNAPHAIGYAFTITNDKKSVNTGEFMGRGDNWEERYDYYLDYKTGVLTS